MGVRTYFRSPLAVFWTLVGLCLVAGVVAVSVRLGALAGGSPFVAGPSAAGGFANVAFVSVFALAVVGVSALVWLPCSLAVAYAVGNETRGRPVSLGDSIELLRSRRTPLYRWVKTRLAIDPIADRILTDEADVRPAEVAVGCDAFVVPVLALDAPTLRAAVGRANRAIPRPGRRRVLINGFGLTGLLIAGAVIAGTVRSGVLPPTAILALAAAVVGAVFTAAIDTAWRVGTYVGQDIDEGFV